MNESVRAYLIGIARLKDRFVYYSDVVNNCALGFDLGTEYGQAELKETLTEVSRYEVFNDRPMLTSLAINKKYNGHSKGFYDLAEELGLGKSNKLKTENWGKVEAVRVREYWQQEDNFKRFADIHKKQEALPDLFNRLIEDDNDGWINEWKEDYLAFVKEVEKLQNAIQLNPTIAIDSSILYSDLAPTLQTYEGFMQKWLKEMRNGISSRGQSVLSEDNFQKIINDLTFKEIAKSIFLSPTVTTFKILTDWWYSNNTINNRPLLINRAFAACKPETLSSTVDSTKFWVAVEMLQANYGFKFNKPTAGNWFIANEQLTVWLDIQLTEVLNKKSSDRLEQIIWRNIFVWLIFSKWNPNTALLPDELVRRNMPKNGFENIPETTRSFKGLEVDFELKAREQKDLGNAGEELVMKYEMQCLTKTGNIEMASKVRIAKDGEGYDVLSFDEMGNKKYIEVKTTNGKELTPFFLSENELDFMRTYKNQYYIYRVYNYDEENNSGDFFEIGGEVENKLLMTPISYRILIKKSD